MSAQPSAYSVPAVLGATIVVVSERLHVYGPVAAGLAAGLTFTLRIVALRRGIYAPRPRVRLTHREINESHE